MKKIETKPRDVLPARENSTDHLDLSQMQSMIFPKLKPSTTTISLRLPDSMLNRIKVMANKKHVPYQSLIKMLLVPIKSRLNEQEEIPQSVRQKGSECLCPKQSCLSR